MSCCVCDISAVVRTSSIRLEEALNHVIRASSIVMQVHTMSRVRLNIRLEDLRRREVWARLLNDTVTVAAAEDEVSVS